MDSVAKHFIERPTFGSVPSAGADRRRHRRVPVTLLGRFMRADKREFACKLIDVSVSGAAIHSPAEVEIGERIVATFDNLGALEGRVVRLFAGGFAIELNATQHKRDKLAAQITWLMNRHELGDAPDIRRHARSAIANASKDTMMRLDEGVVVAVKVIDFSLSGVSVATPARPPLGQEVQVGKIKARVVRHHEDGIGVEFLVVQSKDDVPAELT